MRFTIRDLFWLIAVVALSLGWFFDRWALWGDVVRYQRATYELEAELNKAKGVSGMILSPGD